MPRKPEPIKFCRVCEKQLTRKRYPSGSLESLRDFGARWYCNLDCSGEARAVTTKTFRENAKARIAARKLTPKIQCERCGSNRYLHVHHRDGNPQNNAALNRMVLCSGCHQKEHRKSPPCRICGQKSRCRGLCEKHYARFKRHGNPLMVKINQYYPAILEEPRAAKS